MILLHSPSHVFRHEWLCFVLHRFPLWKKLAFIEERSTPKITAFIKERSKIIINTRESSSKEEVVSRHLITLSHHLWKSEYYLKVNIALVSSWRQAALSLVAFISDNLKTCIRCLENMRFNNIISWAFVYIESRGDHTLSVKTNSRIPCFWNGGVCNYFTSGKSTNKWRAVHCPRRGQNF